LSRQIKHRKIAAEIAAERKYRAQNIVKDCASAYGAVLINLFPSIANINSGK
jgi:hypothetical protein